MQTRRTKTPAMQPLATLCLLLALATLWPSQADAQADGFAGYWQVVDPPTALKTEEGKTPPLNKAGKAMHARRIAAAKAGDHSFDSLKQCLPHGLPRLLLAPYPIEILEETRQLTFLHEAHHMPRLVYLDEDLPPADDLEYNYMGSSVGKRTGRVLDIRSTGFNDLTTLDATGLPHSTQLALQEQFTRSEDGGTLHYRATVTDPVYYTKPWTFRLEFRRLPADTWLKEFVCTDKNPDA
ncbi:MAG: hypothetical protein RL026_1547 [Pseudomonadota bacterium]|jgi:hypothetical protein